jgi:hypothetical protein
VQCGSVETTVFEGESGGAAIVAAEVEEHGFKQSRGGSDWRVRAVWEHGEDHS